MKYIILLLLLFSFISHALAFRGVGGGFRGGSLSVGIGAGGMGPRGNVNVGVGVSGTRGSVAAHRSAPIGVHHHHAYASSYWGWYGYAPYHYYYPSATYSEVEVEAKENKSADEGTVVNDIPKDCKSEVVNEIYYKHCGVNWFEPQFSGTEIEYVVVKPPVGNH